MDSGDAAIFVAFVLLLFIFFIAVTVGFNALYLQGQESIATEAFERGYMVECKGKTGYYWECE